MYIYIYIYIYKEIMDTHSVSQSVSVSASGTACRAVSKRAVSNDMASATAQEWLAGPSATAQDLHRDLVSSVKKHRSSAKMATAKHKTRYIYIYIYIQ